MNRGGLSPFTWRCRTFPRPRALRHSMQYYAEVRPISSLYTRLQESGYGQSGMFCFCFWRCFSARPPVAFFDTRLLSSYTPPPGVTANRNFSQECSSEVILPSPLSFFSLRPSKPDSSVSFRCALGIFYLFPDAALFPAEGHFL